MPVVSRSAGVPLLVAAFALATVLTVASLYGYSPLNSSTWSRWDSGLYEDIARDGYQLFRCEDEPARWCGDAAWFPGYPWVFGGLHQVGLPLRGTAVVVSWFFAAATLVLLWATLLERRASAAAVAALLYAAFAPGQIYYYAVFPLSMLTFTTVACLWLLYTDRLVAAGVAGALAALTYPLGALLAPVAVIWLLLQRERPLGERVAGSAIVASIVAAGLAVIVVAQAFETGRWDAFFRVQEKYAALRSTSNPFVTAWNIVEGVDLSSGLNAVAAVQTLFVTGVLALVLLHALLQRRALAPMDSLLLIWAVVTWSFPLSQSLSIQRGQAALLPLAVLVARLPRTIAFALVGASASIAVWLEYYFLDGTLI